MCDTAFYKTKLTKHQHEIILALPQKLILIFMHTYKLEDQEYIELNKLLKILNLVNSGGEAKMRIRNGEATFNGEVDLRVKKKLRAGDIVTFGGEEIKIE